jgi:catechol 2,3-dioxygenase-like lactoylglutathione lyase family enzyme
VVGSTQLIARRATVIATDYPTRGLILIHAPPDTELTMGTQTIHEDATQIRTAATTDLKIEVVVIPVSDVDRSKRFYESLGWRLDADFASSDDWRLVQMTPPGSPCSVMFGKGFTSAVPGSVEGTFLVVDDLEAARAALLGQGVDVSEVFHFDGNLLRVAGTKGRVTGPDPEDRSYFSFATFSDPDGNGWLVQQVKTRFPGRGFSSDVATLTELLRETEERHGKYEPTAPKHHWSEWYAAYIVARERGRSPEQAADDGARSIARTRGGVQT